MHYACIIDVMQCEDMRNRLKILLGAWCREAAGKTDSAAFAVPREGGQKRRPSDADHFTRERRGAAEKAAMCPLSSAT